MLETFTSPAPMPMSQPEKMASSLSILKIPNRQSSISPITPKENLTTSTTQKSAWSQAAPSPSSLMGKMACAFCKSFLRGTTPLISPASAHAPAPNLLPQQKHAVPHSPFRKELTAIVPSMNQEINSPFSAAVVPVLLTPPKCVPCTSILVQTNPMP